MREDQIRLAAAMVTLEEALSRLYDLFSSRFLRDYVLWLRLAQEEAVHAKAARRLLEQARQGLLYYQDAGARWNMVDNLLQSVAEIAARCREGGLNRRGALKLALDLENSLGERDLFCRFSGAEPKIAGILDLLRAQTANHANDLRKALDDIDARPQDRY